MNEQGTQVALLQEPGYFPLKWGWKMVSKPKNLATIIYAPEVIGYAADLPPGDNQFGEAVGLWITEEGKGKVLAVSIYRHAKTNTKLLVRYIKNLRSLYPRNTIVIGGDFNLHNMAWGSRKTLGDSPLLAKYLTQTRRTLKLLNDGGNTRKGWTASKKPQNHSAIDLTLLHSFKPHLIKTTWTVKEQETSDHAQIVFEIKPQTGLMKLKKKKKLHGKKLTWPKKLRQDKYRSMDMMEEFRKLTQRPEKEIQKEDIQTQSNELLQAIQEASLSTGLLSEISKSQEEKKKKLRLAGEKIWDANLEKEIQSRRKLERKQIKLKKTLLKEKEKKKDTRKLELKILKTKLKFIVKRKEIMALVKFKRSEEWHKCCERLNANLPPGEFWNWFMRISKESPSQHSLDHITLVRDDQTITVTDIKSLEHSFADTFLSDSRPTLNSEIQKEVELLLDQLESLRSAHPTKLPRSDCTCSHLANLEKEITMEELLKTISQEKNSSPGFDGVPGYFLNFTDQSFLDNLLKLLNGCLDFGIFPNIWKLALISLIPKIKDPELPSHYRPISLLATMGKVLELLVTNRISTYLENTGFFNEAQAGFRRGKSTSDHLLDIMDGTKEAWSNDKLKVIITLDISKAFDTVSHDGLLLKLHSKAKIGSRMLLFIESYLRDRKVIFNLDSHSPTTFLNEMGVPQGSPLSPLLFLVYINDLPDEIPKEVQTLLYADDIAILIDIPNNHQEKKNPEKKEDAKKLLQQGLDGIEKWCQDWALSLATHKTQAMILRPNATKNTVDDLELFSGGNQIKFESKEIRYLGVYFDRKLTMTHHIQRLCFLGKNRIEKMDRTRGYDWGVHYLTLKQIYTQWVRPTLEYAPILLAMARPSDLKLLDSVHARALKSALHVGKLACNISLYAVSETHPPSIRRLKLAARTIARILERGENSSITMRWKRLDLKYPNKSTPMDPNLVDNAHEFISSWDIKRWLIDETQITNLSPNIKHQLPSHSFTFSEDSLSDIPKSDLDKKMLAEKLVSSSRKISNSLIVFTDGSLIPGDHLRAGVGYGVLSCHSNAIHLPSKTSIPLHPYSSVYSAELSAIEMALIKTIGHPANPNSVTILSDCRSAVQSILFPSLPCPKLIHNICKLSNHLSRENILTYIKWIPAHTGQKGNEEADRLANIGSKISLDFPNWTLTLPIEDLTSTLERHAISRWKLFWGNTFKASYVHQFITILRKNTIQSATSHLSNQDKTLLFKIITGTSKLMDGCPTMVFAPCSTCGIKGNTFHFLFHCKTTLQERNNLNLILQGLDLSPFSLHSFNLEHSPSYLHQILLSKVLLYLNSKPVRHHLLFQKGGSTIPIQHLFSSQKSMPTV